MSIYRFRNEDTEQEAVMHWARICANQWPALRLLHHIPNGGSRNKKEAVRLKRMGVLAGVSDLHLPAARAGYHGLYIEMKYENGRLSESQKSFLQGAASEDYYCIVCYTAEDAIDVLTAYMEDRTDHPNLAVIKRGQLIKTIA